MEEKKSYRNYKTAFLIPFDFFEPDELDEMEDNDLAFIFKAIFKVAWARREGNEFHLPECKDRYIRRLIRTFDSYNSRAEDNYNISVEKSREGGKNKRPSPDSDNEERPF